MKRLYFLISLISSILLVITSCETTEVVPEADYTYSISRVFWTDSVDNNNDGYTTNRILWIHVNLLENVTRTIHARIYFKALGASIYSFYGQTEDVDIDGVNSPLVIQFMIGPPLNRELLYGQYDFKIEIYESGKDRVEASATRESTTTEGADLLGDQKFESLSTDQIYSINVWWKYIVDGNKNGYASKAALFADVNLEQDVTKNIKIEVYQKEADAEEYSIYSTSAQTTIQYNAVDDSVKFMIGEPPFELNYGSYNFKLVVYEEDVWFPVAILDPEAIEPDPMVDSLINRKFETRIDDGYFYTIVPSSVEWTDEIDQNANGYTASRRLNFNVNVDKNEPRKIWAMVYSQHPDSAHPQLYTSAYKDTAWQIGGGDDDNDIMSIEIGTVADSAKLLYKNEYDFLVNIYEEGDSVAVSSIDRDSTALLTLQKFETASEDTL